MNYKILQKVVDELNKEKPDLSYIRGMIETLLSMKPENTGVSLNPIPAISTPLGMNQVIADAGRVPNLGSISEMVSKSVVTQN